ncbi:MAG: AAA family ATPase [Granulosicoccaceae bacterium]
MIIEAAGERKIVSVLFCDIAGSYTFLYENDPEQGKLIIDDAIATMTSVIERFGGVVNQVQGDGVMSLYGAPQAIEDHALRACDAATELVKTFKDKNTQGLWPNGASIEIRVGISTGEAVVGVQQIKFPSASRNYEYYATGAVSHLAGRLQKLADAFEIVISSSTAELLGSNATTEEVRDRSVHELIKAHAKPHLLTSLDPLDLFDLSPSKLPFVGREAELDFLTDAVAHGLQKREPARILISGDAGIGKSRLIQEFLGIDRQEPWIPIAAAALEIESNSPYALLRRILLSWLEGAGATTLAKQSEHIALICEEIAAENWILPLALSDVLGFALTDSRWENFEPDIKRNQIFKSVLRLLVYWGDTSQTVCVIDDLHWADHVSMKLLKSAITEIKAGSIAFLFTSRSKNTFANEAGVQRIPLGSLSATAARALLISMPVDEPIPENEVDGLLERCAGVPLFIEHIAYSVVPRWDMSSSANYSEGFHFSSQVRTLIQARIDKLPADAKKVLSVASVAGTHFSLRSIVAITESDGPLTQALIELIIGSGLLEPTRNFEEYTFTHALFQEVAYLGILKSRLIEYHCKYLEYFRQTQKLLPDERFTEQIERHAFKGRKWLDVIDYATLAAQDALDSGAYREAMHYLEDAIHALPKVNGYGNEDKQHYMRQHALCLLDLSRAAIPVGEVSRSYDALEDCQSICENLNDDHILCESLAYRTALYAFQGDSISAIECGQRAVKAAEKMASERLIYGCKVYLAEAVFFSGDFTATIELLQPLVDQGAIDRFPLDRIGNAAPVSIDCYGILGMAYAQLGIFDTAESYGRLAKEVADETGKSFDRGLAYFYLTYILVHRLKLEEASIHLRKLQEIVNAGGLQFLRPWVIGLLGFTYALQGRLSDAGELLGQSLSDAQSMSLRIFECYASLSLVFVLTRSGEFKDAQGLLMRVEKLANEAHFNSISMCVTRSKGSLAMAMGQLDDAQMYLKTALDHAQSLGMLPDVAHCHNLLAFTYKSIAAAKQINAAAGAELANERSVKHQDLANSMYAQMKMELIDSYEWCVR